MRKTAIIAFIAPMLVAAALLGGALLSAGTASAQTTTTDYDDNNNGLIDVRTLAQLNAIRYDLDGNGDATHADYIAAFPSRDTSASGRMGCPSGACAGYELRANLDFDTDGDGATYTTSSAGVVTGDAGDTYNNGGAGWTPLGGHQETANQDFTAIFEGNDHTVSNLYINLATTGANGGNYVGLFGDLAATATIRNVGLVDPYVVNARWGAGYNRTGALAGRNNGGTVSGSYVSGGAVTGNQGAVAGLIYNMAGCLLGYNAGTVSDSYATCAATATGADDAVDLAGGLVGWSAGTVRDSYATGTVASDTKAGGLVGFSNIGGRVTDSHATGAVSTSGAGGHAGGLVGHSAGESTVTGSYAVGAVSASGGGSYVGGLAGRLSAGGTGGKTVRASYATGAVSASGNGSYVGGLTGQIQRNFSIAASYAVGAVSASGGGTNRLGGLVGQIEGIGSSVTNSYWDTQTSGQTASAAGVGKTTSELQSPTGYTGIYAGWNLNLDGQTGDDDPWYFGAANQYPVLRYGDHDWDDDGLIEVDRLAQLDAVRWDLNGDGSVDTGTSVADTAKYRAAFGGGLTGKGCLRDHDANTATAKVAGCIGYELTRDLDFDENNDGNITSADDDYWNGGKGWKPIGGSFTATFNGNGKTIANLFSGVGLFGSVGTGGRVERLGVLDVNVTGPYAAGGLVGWNSGTINASYATGSITGGETVGSLVGVGGLVGWNSGTISASYATVSVSIGSASTGPATSSVTGSGHGDVAGVDSPQRAVTASYWNIVSYAAGSTTRSSQSPPDWKVGGLVGYNYRGTIRDSYATGPVTGPLSALYSDVGGLVGESYFGTISASYATGSVTGRDRVGGLVGKNYIGTIITSYATGSVTGRDRVGGLVGYNHGYIRPNYATGSVTGTSDVGGLVGLNAMTVDASYATGSVTGNQNVGGLVGGNGATIIASYATGSVTGNQNVGGLAGLNGDPYNRSASVIHGSYATGAVKGTGSNVGGLVGSKTGRASGRAINSYWDTGTTGQATSAGGTGKTTRELQLPIGYSDIYAAWNLHDVDDADGDHLAHTGVDDVRDFGTSRQYPVLKYGSIDPSKQRQTAIQSPNWNAPVVGEPVTASLNVTGATGITWQWQSSADGSIWTDIANATGATYIPVAADAASGGKFLRAKATFTASGSSRTLTTANTAKVAAAATAGTGAVALVPDVTVGAELEYAVSGAGTTDHSWHWQRCTNKAMTSGCAYIGDDAATYRIVAADVGKYLRAYVYYADGSAWKRATTPVLGPVVAAPAAAPSASQ